MGATANERMYEFGFCFEQYEAACKAVSLERLKKHCAKLAMFEKFHSTLAARKYFACKVCLERMKAEMK